MAKLFGKSKSTINEHIMNIYKENELSDKPTNIYNLDVIISVGYRVKSKNGILFRKWATSVLKDYMLKGVAINNKRLDFLEKSVKLIEIANRSNDRISNSEAKDILKVIGEYTKSLDLLDDYDYKTLSKIKGNKDGRIISYDECIKLISKLKFNNNSYIFGMERNKGLESIINDIYLTFDGKDVYESIELKACNFLYTLIFIKIDTLEKAKNAPCIFNNWANFYKGKFISNTILNANSFEKLLK